MREVRLVQLPFGPPVPYHHPRINLDRCNGRCNALDNLSNRICIPNKIEEVNFSGFNKITKINDSKTLAKFISCKCKCKFMVENVTRSKVKLSGIAINVDVSENIR